MTATTATLGTGIVIASMVTVAALVILIAVHAWREHRQHRHSRPLQRRPYEAPQPRDAHPWWL